MKENQIPKAAERRTFFKKRLALVAVRGTSIIMQVATETWQEIPENALLTAFAVSALSLVFAS